MPLVFGDSDLGHCSAPASADFAGCIQCVEMCWVPITIFSSIKWEKKIAKTKTVPLQVREER